MELFAMPLTICMVHDCNLNNTHVMSYPWSFWLSYYFICWNVPLWPHCCNLSYYWLVAWIFLNNAQSVCHVFVFSCLCDFCVVSFLRSSVVEINCCDTHTIFWTTTIVDSDGFVLPKSGAYRVRSIEKRAAYPHFFRFWWEGECRILVCWMEKKLKQPKRQ